MAFTALPDARVDVAIHTVNVVRCRGRPDWGLRVRTSRQLRLGTVDVGPARKVPIGSGCSAGTKRAWPHGQKIGKYIHVPTQDLQVGRCLDLNIYHHLLTRALVLCMGTRPKGNRLYITKITFGAANKPQARKFGDGHSTAVPGISAYEA